MESPTYSQIISLNRDLHDRCSSLPYRILLLSNAVIGNLKEVLEFSLRTNDINAEVVVGSYDNIVQDSAHVDGYQAAIVFWESWNFLEGLHSSIALMPTAQ